MKDHEKYAEEVIEKVLPFTPAEEEFEYPYAYELAILLIQEQIEANSQYFADGVSESSYDLIEERQIFLRKSIEYLKEKL